MYLSHKSKQLKNNQLLKEVQIKMFPISQLLLIKIKTQFLLKVK